MEAHGFTLINGGRTKCTSLWNSFPNGRDRCYKLYYIVEGSAYVRFEEDSYYMTEGNYYFINGFQLSENRCDTSMTVIWLHFMPESLFLSTLLSELPCFYMWRISDNELKRLDPSVFITFFEQPNLFSANNPLKKNYTIESSLRLQGILSLLLSEFIANHKSSDPDANAIHAKLKKSLAFIEGNYTADLTLAEMAQPSYLNPSYFLRLFKQVYNQTPHNYLITLRLHSACQKLKQTDLSIKEISESLGFCNQFHFSKVFKDYYGMTPSMYRKTSSL